MADPMTTSDALTALEVAISSSRKPLTIREESDSMTALDMARRAMTAPSLTVEEVTAALVAAYQVPSWGEGPYPRPRAVTVQEVAGRLGIDLNAALSVAASTVPAVPDEVTR